MRLVGGSLRGRKLAAPRPAELKIRPTSERVREALFNILGHAIAEFDIAGARVLDLFAGTGALGLEALSRGAACCLFVEQAATARGLIRRNIEAFELSGMTRLYRRDATELGKARARDVADLAFVDPPYGKGLGRRALDSALSGGWLAQGAVVVIEERAGLELPLPPQLLRLDQRSYGDTQIIFARFDAGRRQALHISPALIRPNLDKED